MLNKIKRFFKKDIISEKDKFQHNVILGTMNTGRTDIDSEIPLIKL